MLDSTVKLNSVLNGPLAPFGERVRVRGTYGMVKFKRASIAGCDAGASYPATVNVFYINR